MKKIFILGGSSLQLDLILEAKRMFFYTIVLDGDKNCVGAKWCDKFLHIDISDKELVLEQAKEYDIDLILTSATELGNVTACWVGEKLGLNSNSYQTALNTTNKVLMKEIFKKHKINIANYSVVDSDDSQSWDKFPSIVKPSDSSAGRGLSFCKNEDEIKKALKKASLYSKGEILIEEYIEGKQYSIESISCGKKHQIVAINREYIHPLPDIMEIGHEMPAKLDEMQKNLIEDITYKLLEIFDIAYGACHIEMIIKDGEVFVVEIASRTGGMRSEMISLAFGISYSQLLLFSYLDHLNKINYSQINRVKCNFIVTYGAYLDYLEYKKSSNYLIFEPFKIPKVEDSFKAENIGESKGYYFILEESL